MTKVSHSNQKIVGIKKDEFILSKGFWFTICFLSCWNPISAQSYPSDNSENMIFENITWEKALPHPYTPAVVQDAQGFIWFSNKKGLIRYDGLTFKTYQHHPADSNSLSNSFVWCMIQDHAGLIWVATHGGGLNLFDPATESFSVFPLTMDGENKGQAKIIWSVMEDSQHRLWVGTRGAGLFIINPERDSTVHFLHDASDSESLSGNAIGQCYEDSEGRFWVPAASNGLNLFDPSSGKSRRFQHDVNTENSLPNGDIYNLTEDQDGRLWLATWNGLSVLDLKDTSFTNFYHEPENPNSLSNNLIYRVTIDSRNKIWLATGLGLSCYDPGVGKFSRFFYDPLNAYSLLHDVVYSVYEAVDGTLWITTANGISKLRPNSFSFISLVQTLEEKKRSNFENGCRDILEDRNGNIWVLTANNGWYRYESENNIYQHFLPYPGWRNDHIEESPDGRIWIAGSDGLVLMDQSGTKFQNLCDLTPALCREEPLLHDFLTFALSDSGYIWAAPRSSEELIKIDPLNGEIQKRYLLPLRSDGSSIMSVRAVRKDIYGNLWLAGEGGGLQHFDIQRETFSQLELPVSVASSLAPAGEAVYSIDSKGYIWIQDGINLLRFRPDVSGNPNEFLRWTNSGGRFHEDKKGKYWLVKADGITAFDPERGPLRTYSLKGVTESLDGSLEGTRSGDIYLGGHQGLFYFNPDHIMVNTQPPAIVLTDLRVYNQSAPIQGSYGDTLLWRSQLEQSIRLTEEIELQHDQNEVTFEFAALDFHQPECNQYKYLLEGYNADTLRTNADRPFASYTNLSPGKYTFRVWAANNDGLWNSNDASLLITVFPPWWLSTGAKTCYIIVGLGVLFLVRKLELRRQRKKLEEEQRINAVTSKFVPSAFLSSLGRNDLMEVKLGDAVAQEVTVMFSDIRDYTSLSENMTPQETFQFVTDFNRRMGPVIQRNEGFVNQYLGDAIMALFKNSPKDGLSAAIQMQQTLSEYNILRNSASLPPIQIGIGLHTGPLVMGIIGDEERMDAATISDAVNTASRIESLTKHYKVNILLSEESLRQIQDQEVEDPSNSFGYHFRFLGNVQLKGKKDTIGIYECFDGDLPETIGKKMETYALFDQALKKYFMRSFGEAQAIFDQVLEIHPDDWTARFFLEKSKYYLSVGVANDWTGVEVMTIK